MAKPQVFKFPSPSFFSLFLLPLSSPSFFSLFLLPPSSSFFFYFLFLLFIYFLKDFPYFSSSIFVICDRFTCEAFYMQLFLDKYKNIKTLNIYKNIVCSTVQSRIIVKNWRVIF